jgi:hypothetical protein
MDREAFHHSWDGYDPEDHHSDICPDAANMDHWMDDHKKGDPVDTKVRDRYAEPLGGDSHWLSNHPESDTHAWNFKRHLEKQGHDGVVYGNAIERPIGHKCAITFDTNQVHNLRRFSGEGWKQQTAVKRTAMAWDDHTNDWEKRPSVMYHHSHPDSRESILQHGLRASDPYDPSIHEHEGMAPKGVYLSHEREPGHGEDVWEVNTEGLHLPDDPDDTNREYGYQYHEHDIPPHRLKLVERSSLG